MKFPGGYDDGYPDGQMGQAVDLHLTPQMVLSDFMRVVSKFSTMPLPEMPPAMSAGMARLAADFNRDKETRFEMDEKKITALTIIMLCVSRNNGAPTEAVAEACSQYAKLMVAPRYLWGHFLLDLQTFSYSCDEMGRAYLTKKYNLPASHWSTPPWDGPDSLGPVTGVNPLLLEALAKKIAADPEVKRVFADPLATDPKSKLDIISKALLGLVGEKPAQSPQPPQGGAEVPPKRKRKTKKDKETDGTRPESQGK